MQTELKIGGIQPFTTIDFPGRLAAVIFMQGCNLRCAYCHNPELVNPCAEGKLKWSDVLSFLERRRGFLDGVVFSGGEPLLQPQIEYAIECVKALGFEVAIHTNGLFPKTLEALIEKYRLSYIAMDIKATRDGYLKFFGVENFDVLLKSVAAVVGSGVEYEFRTTVHSALVSNSDILDIADLLKNSGAERFVLQKFKPGRVLNSKLSSFSGEFIGEATLKKLAGKFKHFEVRGDNALLKHSTKAA